MRADVTDYTVTDAMMTYGGSFVQALGRAWRLADPPNQERLSAAFEDVFEKYLEIAAQAAARELEAFRKEAGRTP
jgi:hypothetical protein